MAQLLIVADDLTGAADTGACFAARGLATVIPLTRGADIDADVVVLSTETRDLSGEDAARVVAETANYAGTDLVCYRADRPPELAARLQAGRHAPA